MFIKNVKIITILFTFLAILLPSLSCNAGALVISKKGAWQIIQDMRDYDFKSYKLNHVGDGQLSGEPVQYYMVTNPNLDVSITFICNSDGYPVGISTLTPKSEAWGGKYACAVLVSALDGCDQMYMSVSMQSMGHAMRRGEKREIAVGPGKYYVCYGYDAAKYGHPNHYGLNVYKL